MQNTGKTNPNHAIKRISIALSFCLLIDAAYAIDCAKESTHGEAVKCLQDMISALSSQPVINIPSGAVIAFASKDCPDGWREYTPAYGRFIRGIDRGNPKIDPDGERSIGSPQSDQILSHRHRVMDKTVQNYEFKPGSSGLFAPANGPNATVDNYFETTPPLNLNTKVGTETRPHNVALLYCEKK